MPDDRPYIRVHDGVDEHPKVDGLSDAGFRLLVSNWCWCSRNKTDGRIRAATWGKRGSARSRKELLDSGLAALLDNGDVEMHDYLEHQRSAAEIEELKAKRRAAGQAGGLAKARASAVASAVAKPQQSDSKNVASTDTTTEELEASSSRRGKRAVPPPDIMPITDEMRDWATEHAPDVRLVVQTAKLLDWARGKGEKKQDWLAAWRNWMRSDQERIDKERAGRPAARASNGVYSDADEAWMR